MPFYFENLAYFVPSTETKKINGFAPIHPRLVRLFFMLKVGSLVIIKNILTIRAIEPARHGPVHAAFFYDMSNRVEHQKLNQVGAGRPPPG